MNIRLPLAPLKRCTCLVVFAGCDPEFTVAREDLGPARIAALGCDLDAAGQRVARAAIWSGLGLYHEQSPALSWTLDGAPLGEGYGVAVPDGETLGLVATMPDGTVLSGTVPVADPLAELSLLRASVDLGADLSLEARQAAVVQDEELSAAEGQAQRLTLAMSGDTAALSTHWMLAQGVGSVLSEATLAADVLAEEIRWEDGAVVERLPLDPGLFPGLALVMDGAGANRWLWFDAAIGFDLPAVRHGGRILPLLQADGETVAAEAAASGWIEATISAADDPAGMALIDAVASTAIEGAPDLSGQDLLACAPPGEPFQLDWVVEGRCPLPELLGARVVLELW